MAYHVDVEMNEEKMQILLKSRPKKISKKTYDKPCSTCGIFGHVRKSSLNCRMNPKHPQYLGELKNSKTKTAVVSHGSKKKKR